MTTNPGQANPWSPGPQNAEDTTPGSGAGRLPRRTVLGGGLAAAAAGSLGVFAAPAVAATPTLAGHGGGHDGSFQTVSGHALYLLPQDHKWHTGGIFDTGQLQEWQDRKSVV